MSVVAVALRLCAVKALKGNTWAEDRVFASSIDPIDTAIAEQRKPLIVVLTEDDVIDPEGKDVLNGTRSLDLIIEMAVASRVVTTVENDQATAIVIPETDEGSEISIDLLGRQVLRRLLSDESPWAVLFKTFVTKISKITGRRGASSKDGIRFAARQLVITCDTISEPSFDGVLADDGPWRKFLDLMAADDELADVGKVIENQITTNPLSDWMSAAADLGVPSDTVRDIGVGPAFAADDNDANPPYPAPNEANLVETVAVKEEGDTQFQVDEAEIDDALPPED